MRTFAILAIALVGSTLNCAAQKIEVKSADVISNSFDPVFFVIPEGKVAEIVDFYVTKGLTATANDGTQAVLETTPLAGAPRPMLTPRQWSSGAPFGGQRPIKLIGPLQLRLRAEAGSNVRYFIYYKLTDNVGTSGSQEGQTVVIPEDATGTVEIKLESSKDLVNWTAANPGIYDPTTVENRFFRVRAVNIPAE